MALGVDLGGTKFDVALVDEDGRVLARRREPTGPHSPPPVILDGVAASIHGLCQEAGVSDCTVGVGIAGQVDGSTGEVVDVEPRALKVMRRWTIKPCDEPSGLAIDVAHERLFSVCDDVMTISDARAGRLLTTVRIGAGPDGAAYDPALGLAFSSNGAGTVTVVHPTGAMSYGVLQTVPTQRSARTIALDPRRHRLYLSAAEFGAAPPAAPGQRPQRPPLVPGSCTVLVVER